MRSVMIGDERVGRGDERKGCVGFVGLVRIVRGMQKAQVEEAA